jgi:hypothetical protein
MYTTACIRKNQLPHPNICPTDKCLSSMRALFFTFPAIGAMANLVSCRSMATATSQEKSTSIERHSANWKVPEKLEHFSSPRSVQLFDPRHARIKERKVIPGKVSAMAALITDDGYALTAAHVVKKPELTACFFQTAPGRSEAYPLHFTKLRLKEKREGKPASFVVLLLQEKYSPRPPLHLNARIVKLFPRQDLALLKLPLTGTLHFTIKGTPLTSGTVLFMSGNSMSYTPGPSAGTLCKSPDHTRTLYTTLPSAPGDSGSPVMDATGNLVGVASRAWPHRYFPFLPVSAMAPINSAALQTAIAADRFAETK